MMTMSVLEKYLVDRGYRQGQQSSSNHQLGKLGNWYSDNLSALDGFGIKIFNITMESERTFTPLVKKFLDGVTIQELP